MTVENLFGNDNAIHALAWPWETGALPPLTAPVAFLGARLGGVLPRANDNWVLEQPFRPLANALMAQGWDVKTRIEAENTFATVLLLPPRSRDATRALLARAVQMSREGATLVAAAANDEGGRTLAADMARLLGNGQSLSKQKCRIAIGTHQASTLDAETYTDWLALSAWQQRGTPPFWTRPGLFAWDRVDTASALLAEHLPSHLRGQVADLGAGWGFLSRHCALHCAGIQQLDLYEADALSVEAAQRNLAGMPFANPALRTQVHWHDVTTGLPDHYDAIISNPPFHLGRADVPELGKAFITRAAEALRPHGELWLVANRHLPYETLLQQRFNTLTTVVIRQGFKVLHAQGPKK